MIASAYDTGRTDRLLKGLRQTAPASPVMVYHALKVNGQFINDPDCKRGLIRIEYPPSFVPKFNPPL